VVKLSFTKAFVTATSRKHFPIILKMAVIPVRDDYTASETFDPLRWV
jgi:hypothetical protein